MCACLCDVSKCGLYVCLFDSSLWLLFYMYLHPSKKVTHHDFDRLYLFYPGYVFIKLDIPGKPVYLPFDWCLICSDCFTEACVGWVNWGQWQKGRVAKLIGCYGKCMLCLVSCSPFVSACTHTRARARAHSLAIHCTEILRNKTSCWISNSDAILEHLFFDIASNIITLHTFLTGNHNK